MGAVEWEEEMVSAIGARGQTKVETCVSYEIVRRCTKSNTIGLSLR